MYTDPGVVSMIIAAVVGTILAIPTYLFIIRKKIGAWFNERRKRIKKGPR